MLLSQIIEKIEQFAPIETQEGWDCSGYLLDFGRAEIENVLLCLSVTPEIIRQAEIGGFDLIISHHPLFYIPFEYKKIPIYCAHTNLDKARGGTTDSLITLLDLGGDLAFFGDFVRVLTLNQAVNLNDLVAALKSKLKLKNLRVVNNSATQKVSRIAFCAGSGADLIKDAAGAGADVFVTGDVKYHTALESNVIIIDVGHFESERPVLDTLKGLFEDKKLRIEIADEKSPFIDY